MGGQPGLSASAPYQHRLAVQEGGGSESHVMVETGREGRVTGPRALGSSSLCPGQSPPPHLIYPRKTLFRFLTSGL